MQFHVAFWYIVCYNRNQQLFNFVFVQGEQKMKKRNAICSLILAGVSLSTLLLQGCGSGKTSDGKIEVELLQYKPEAVAAFEAMEERFNATHDNIHLTIESPNEAVTVLKTRLIREDYPDIIGIGGDINYSNFLECSSRVPRRCPCYKGYLHSLQHTAVHTCHLSEQVPILFPCPDMLA